MNYLYPFKFQIDYHFDIKNQDNLEQINRIVILSKDILSLDYACTDQEYTIIKTKDQIFWIPNDQIVEITMTYRNKPVQFPKYIQSPLAQKEFLWFYCHQTQPNVITNDLIDNIKDQYITEKDFETYILKFQQRWYKNE